MANQIEADIIYQWTVQVRERQEKVDHQNVWGWKAEAQPNSAHDSCRGDCCHILVCIVLFLFPFSVTIVPLTIWHLIVIYFASWTDQLSRWLILRLFRPSATQSERTSQVFPSNTFLCHSHINESINHHCFINTILSLPKYRKLNIVLLMLSAKLRLALARSRHVSDFSRRTNALAARFDFQTMNTAIIVMLRVMMMIMTTKWSRFKTSLCASASTINWTLLSLVLATMLAGFHYLQTLWQSDHLYFDDQTYIVLQAFTM